MKLKGLSQEIFLSKYAYPGETEWDQRAEVIATSVARAEVDSNITIYKDKFKDILTSGDFIPGGRIIFGSGRQNYNLLNCYVLWPDDSVNSIAKIIHDSYLISCGGGGIGYDFSRIRPRGDDVQNIKYSAPGSISVMKMINEIGEHVRAGASRRTALMAILRVDHPDLLEFLSVKLNRKELQNFNISVAITNDFIKAVEKNKEWSFKFRNKIYNRYSVEGSDGNQVVVVDVVGTSSEDALARAIAFLKPTYTTVFHTANLKPIKAKEIWETLFTSAVQCGDPGIFNVDLANSYTNVSYFEYCPSTNPCYAKGSLVMTPQGFRRIEDIKVNDSISTIFNTGKVKTIEKHESVPIYKVKLSDGSEHRVTAAHQFHAYRDCTNNGFYTETRVDNLLVGDSIRIEPGTMEGTNCLAPKDWDEYTFGLFNGVLLGDGCYTQSVIDRNQVKISSHSDDTEWNKKLESLLYKAGATKVNYYINKDTRGRPTKSLTLSAQNKSIIDFITNKTYLLPDKAINKKIPLEFLQSNRSFLLGLIDGLISTDGNVNLKGNQPAVRYKTSSFDLAQNFRRICLLLGIHARIYSGMTKSHSLSTGRIIDTKNPYYEVHITGDCLVHLSKILTLSHPSKQDKLAKIKKFCSSSSNRFRAQVVSIEPDGVDEVFDLFEPESDTWIVDGAVSRGCGEISIPAYGNCCLGHINLANMCTDDGTILWKKIASVVRLGIRFLDNVLTINHFAVSECKEVADRSRRIGFGVTGLHYFLIKAGYRYGDEKCCEFTERLFQTIRDEAYKASIEVAKEKGSFQLFDSEKYLDEEFCKTLPPRIRADIKKYGIRNAVMLTCAPCGTTSMVLGVSTGIEPIFSPIYERSYRQGSIWKTQLVTDPLFKKYFDSNDKRMSLCVGAYDVTPEEHIKMQASIQKYIDMNLSKTCNLPENITYSDIEESLYNYASSVKGFTIYRSGSRGKEPLKAVSIEGLSREEIDMILNKSVDYGVEESSPSMCSITKGTCE